MAETSRSGLDLAWKERDVEAALMTAGGFQAMALALRVYSLEIQLKSLICRHLRLEYLPRSCKTHDLTELVIYTGLWAELTDPASGTLFANWSLVAEFSKKRLNDLRYQANSVLTLNEIQELTSALDDPTNGVLA